MAEISLAASAAEIASVALTSFLVWSSALAQHLSNVASRGSDYVMSDRSTAPDMAGFFGRATRTLANNMESALMYAPAVLGIVLLGQTSGLSHLTAYTYMAARTLFTVSYWLKIPVIRSLLWLVGMICCAIMYLLAALALSTL